MKFRHTILIFVFLLIYSGVSGVMSVDHSNAQESEVAGLSVTPSNTGSGAGGTGNTGSGAGGTGNTGSGAGGTGSGGSGGGVVLFDPIDKSIEDIFLAILDIILVFAIPIILFFIIWAGFLYVTAQRFRRSGGKRQQPH